MNLQGNLIRKMNTLKDQIGKSEELEQLLALTNYIK